MSLNTKLKEKKAKRKYNVRQKNRPKRPLSAYNLFFRFERERIVRETLEGNGQSNVDLEGKIRSAEKTRTGKRVHRKTHGAIGFAELGKRISEAWRNMSDKDKAPFQAEADREKQLYQRQLGTLAQPVVNDRVIEGEKVVKCMPQRELGVSPTKFQRKDTSGRFYDRHNAVHTDKHLSTHSRPLHNGYQGFHENHCNFTPQSYARFQHDEMLPTNGFRNPQYSPMGFHPSYNKDSELPKSNPQQQTAHAFHPPYPTHQYNRHKDSKYINWSSEHKLCDFAFQCEVCNKSVFSTYEECAKHEEECAKRVGDHHLPQMNQEMLTQEPDWGNGENYILDDTLRLSSENRECEKKEQQQAVEAVMMLKWPVEC
mmetsp:Transcript_11424/g.24366  ORF Transcript_11424/g.24366 Transcript_11424/m.24366 type:complete len:369 (+) Transcript_11424:338-1444(+)